MKARYAVWTALALCLSLAPVSMVSGSPEAMKGPGVKLRMPPLPDEPETSLSRIVLLGTLTLYQRYVSPIDGERCGFSPSCSAFAREAVGRDGALAGIVVTADRLMRCTLLKGRAPDYLLLPGGRLFDPVEYNLLSSP